MTRLWTKGSRSVHRAKNGRLEFKYSGFRVKYLTLWEAMLWRLLKVLPKVRAYPKDTPRAIIEAGPYLAKQIEEEEDREILAQVREELLRKELSEK